ncbi:mitochondrial distribution and morphology protein family 31/32 [Coemansia mojavensis]|nr:mitochondrial distribution and morphology protein family 31/32 [Coemansia mojavensis]
MDYFSTRQDILREISGFFPRLKARLYRALKGSYQKRPWTIDDIFALVSWVVMSQAMLLLIGTTTTVSVALWLLNRLQFQDWIAYKLSQWISSALGITVSFESAIAPAWRNGSIRFKNVKIRCGPEHGVLQVDGSRDTNFTMYDLHIDHIDVVLSLWRWMDDRGLVSECSMRGIRGVVDRRQVWWDPNIEYIPEKHRHTHRPGRFDLDALAIEDMLLTVYPWQNFRQITVSIYSANLPRFRDRWLLYDTLNANSIVGMYDGSLFTIHRAHQRIPSYASHISNAHSNAETSRERMTHIQIDNLGIDHINSGVEGPVGWITSGKLNVSALIAFPTQLPGTDPAAAAIKRIVDDINDSIDVRTSSWSRPLNPVPTHQIGEALQNGGLADHLEASTPAYSDPNAVHVDLQVEFNDIRAAIPHSGIKEGGMLSAVLVRPTIAYMNAHRTSLPMRCQLRLRSDDFDGAWSFWDSGADTLITQGIGAAFAQLAQNERERNRRLKLVGWWSITALVKQCIRVFDFVYGSRSFFQYFGLSPAN